MDSAPCSLRGPTDILFISRDTCSDSVAKLVALVGKVVGKFGGIFWTHKIKAQNFRGKFRKNMPNSLCRRATLIWGLAQASRDTLQNGVSHRCACVKLSIRGGRGSAPFYGSADLPGKVSRDMGYRSNKSGSNAAPLVSRYSCRTTLSHFLPCVFAMSHENRAIPLINKVSQKRPCSTPVGGVSHLNFALYKS